MNRYSVELQALLRVCLSVMPTEGDMVESDLWALGNDARGLLNAFTMRRMLRRYGQDSLNMMARKLSVSRVTYA